MTKRYNGLDLFRIISFIGVLWLHCAQSNAFHASLASFGKLSVSCFIMMSGAMVMSGNKEYTFIQWLGKTAKKLVVPWLLASLFYVLENVLLTIKHGDVYRISEDAESVIRYGYPVRGWHLWYLYLLTFIYLIVPLLKVIRAKGRYLYYLVFAVLFLTDMMWEPSLWVLVFITYIWKFMAGDIIFTSLSGLTDGKRRLLYFITCMCLIARAGCVFAGFINRSERSYVEGPLFSALICVLLMLSFTNMKLKGDYFRFAKYIMLIYIVHVFVGDVFSGIMIALKMDGYISWWTIIRDSVIILVFSYGIALILNAVIRYIYGSAIVSGLLRQRKIT